MITPAFNTVTLVGFESNGMVVIFSWHWGVLGQSQMCKAIQRCKPLTQEGNPVIVLPVLVQLWHIGDTLAKLTNRSTIVIYLVLSEIALLQITISSKCDVPKKYKAQLNSVMLSTDQISYHSTVHFSFWATQLLAWTQHISHPQFMNACPGRHVRWRETAGPSISGNAWSGHGPSALHPSLSLDGLLSI